MSKPPEPGTPPPPADQSDVMPFPEHDSFVGPAVTLPAKEPAAGTERAAGGAGFSDGAASASSGTTGLTANGTGPGAAAVAAADQTT